MMKDNEFIATSLQKGKEAKEKVSHEFSGITHTQLNWRATPESWSIAQCLDHLIIADSAYFPDLKKITEGTYKMSLWERYSPFTAVNGSILKKRLQETVGKKMIAPKSIRPSILKTGLDIIGRYDKNLDTFLEYISNCRDLDINKIVITSPTIKIVTYTLKDAFTFLLTHEHRHINQAIRVKANKGFPH